MTDQDALNRIAGIDSLFENATTWGSWMVSAANEREQLVNRLRKNGHQIEHKYQARTPAGGPVS